MSEAKPSPSSHAVKRAPILVPFSAVLIKALSFDRWPKSPVEWEGETLVTEPTPAHVHDWIVRDTKTPGFAVRLTKGSKSFIVERKRRGTETKRRKLLAQDSLTSARAEAGKWLQKLAEDKDPLEEIRALVEQRKDADALSDRTFKVVYDEFLSQGQKRVEGGLLKPSSVTDRKKLLGWMANTQLWSTPLAEIDVTAVAATFEPIFFKAGKARDAKKRETGGGKTKRGGGPSADVATAHKCVTHCATAWNQAVGVKAAANPFSAWRNDRRKKLPRVERRTTKLPMRKAEGVLWLKSLNDLRDDPRFRVSVVAAYMLLVVLWGGRKTEMSLIRWADVDWNDRWACFLADTTKGNKDHYVPLAPWAAEILTEQRQKNKDAGFPVGRNDLVFPHPTKKGGHLKDYRYVSGLLEAMTTPNVAEHVKPLSEGHICDTSAKPRGLKIGLHDLRRTLAGELFGESKNLGTVAIALGHSSAQDVTAGYVEALEAVEGLRPLYEARERRLRRLIGLDDGPAQEVTSDQKPYLLAAVEMLKRAGLDPEDLVAQLRTL